MTLMLGALLYSSVLTMVTTLMLGALLYSSVLTMVAGFRDGSMSWVPNLSAEAHSSMHGL